MNKARIMITGAGAPGAYGIIKSLRNNNIVEKILGIDIKSNVSNEKYLDKFIQGPHNSDVSFISTILEICILNSINIVIPLVTNELEALSKSKDLFLHKGIKVIVMDSEKLELVNNKYELMNFLKLNGIRVPNFELVKDNKSFEFGLKKLGYPKNVVCFKPSVSNGSRGFRIIDSAVDEFDLLFNHKPNNLYMSVEKFLEIIKDRVVKDIILMDYLPGDEYSVDVYYDSLNEVIIPRKRLVMNGGISTTIVVENNYEVINYCREIISCLNIKGAIGIQVRLGLDGLPYVLEINPRLQGTVVASVAAGANIPLYLIMSSLGLEVKVGALNWGMKMIRFWEESYFDMSGKILDVSF
jgi:carbamoyl-phosphate synthase large subunit